MIPKNLVVLIEKWMEEKKVGKITISFFKGGISSIKKEETLKVK